MGKGEVMTVADWAPPHVRPYVEAVIATIQDDPRVVGLTAGGSAVTGTMDEFSDLDLVVVCRDEHQPELLAGAPAFAAGLGPLLACFTGEHVGEPRLLIALYGPPPVHVDLKFVADSQLDQRVEDGLILWQRDGALDVALRRAVPTWYGASSRWRPVWYRRWRPRSAPTLRTAVLPRCARRSPSTASCTATPPRWSGAPAPRPRASATSLRSRRGCQPGSSFRRRCPALRIAYAPVPAACSRESGRLPARRSQWWGHWCCRAGRQASRMHPRHAVLRGHGPSVRSRRQHPGCRP